MTSLSSLSPHELERLSAYADGELEPQEAEGLRARLQQEPGLRRALDEIRRTSGLLRSLPALKPPRAFTLTAERAAVARRYPRLQLATALAGLAFFLVVGVDLFARTGMAAARPPAELQFAAAPAEPGMVQEQPPAEKEQPEAGLHLEAADIQTPEPTQAVARAAELAATPSPVGETAAAEESAAAPQTATAPSYADALQGTQPATEAEPLALSLRVEVTVLGEDQAAPAGALEADQVAGLEPASEPVPSAGQESEAAPFRTLTRLTAGLGFRLAEIGLGGAALVLAVLTVRSRRRR